MRAQHHGRECDLLARIAGGRSSVSAALAGTRACQRSQSASCCCSDFANGCIRLDTRQRGGGFGAAAKAERQDRPARQFAHQRDIARARPVVLPGQRAVAGEILPAVAAADIAGAGRAEGVVLLLDRRRRAPARTAPARPHSTRRDAVALDRGDIVVAGAAEMRREQRVGPQVGVTVLSRHSISSTSRRGSGVTRSRSVSAGAGARSRPPAPGRQQPQRVVAACA